MSVRKLNKKLIYWCLVLTICLVVPALVSLTSFSKVVRASERQPLPQGITSKREAFAISGVEKFPESYDEMRKFEEKQNTLKQEEETFKDALIKKEQELQNEPIRIAHSSRNAESESRHYSSRSYASSERSSPSHSDIMFINKTQKTENHGADFERKNAQQSDLFFKRDSTSSNKNLLDRQGEFMVTAGTLLDAILLSEINTDLPGPIIARVSHNIWDSRTGKKLLIPQNSKLIGEYNASVGHGQNRAQIHWQRIIFPNQQSIDLGKMVGVDKKGASGTEGQVNNHYDKVALGLVLSTAIGSSVRMTQGKYDRSEASLAQDVGNALAQESAQLGNKIANKMLDTKPTITVPMGQRINVFVERDLLLMPYED